VPQPVADEIAEPEALHEVVPMGCVTHGRGGQDTAARPTLERLVGRPTSCQTTLSGSRRPGSIRVL
jgi:hypothetical protein